MDNSIETSEVEYRKIIAALMNTYILIFDQEKYSFTNKNLEVDHYTVTLIRIYIQLRANALEVIIVDYKLPKSQVLSFEMALEKAIQRSIEKTQSNCFTFGDLTKYVLSNQSQVKEILTNFVFFLNQEIINFLLDYINNAQKNGQKIREAKNFLKKSKFGQSWIKENSFKFSIHFLVINLTYLNTGYDRINYESDQSSALLKHYRSLQLSLGLGKGYFFYEKNNEGRPFTVP